MKRTNSFFITALLIGFTTQLYAQDKLNLNFEKINPVTHTFDHWNMNMSATGSEGYISGIDSAIKERGKYSLFIEKDTANKNGGIVGSCINHILVNFKGKEIELTGYVRTQDVTKFASIIIRLKNSNGEVTNNLAQLGKGIRGTTGWTKYSYKMPIDSTIREIGIVPNLMGDGKAWFDNFKLYVDGVPYDSVHQYNFSFFPTAQIEWLKKNVIPIKNINPNSSLTGLSPLKGIVDNARIVGLGEFTHGTRETFILKHKLIEFLVEKMHFSIIAIEANMADTYNINQYVLTGEGDPKLLLGNLFAQLNNPEMLDLIEWIRKYNETAKDKVQFIGIDLQRIDDALDYLMTFASKYDKSLLSKLGLIHKWTTYGDFDKIYATSAEKDTLKKNAEEIYKYIYNHEQNYVLHISHKKYAWLKQSAMILVQAQGYLTSFSDEYRDSCMTRNISWILEQNPRSKMILWSHNLHIGNRGYFMGHLLKEKYGNDYLSVGFLGNSGTYTAFKEETDGRRKLTTGELTSDYVGSYEYRFHQIGTPMFILDLRRISSVNPACSWLTKSMKMRVNVGSIIQNNNSQQFRMTDMKKTFDAIIYLDSTHHSRPYGLGDTF